MFKGLCTGSYFDKVVREYGIAVGGVG